MPTNTKFSVRCFDSDVLVVEKNMSYELRIQSKLNPLGQGNPLESFQSEEDAIEAAHYFCGIYTIAKEKGYYLQNNAFHKPDKQKLDVSWVIHKRFTSDEWQQVLAGNAAEDLTI
jgi:hypothetical protein